VRILAKGRPAAAGVSFGLAILTRSLAALPLIPVGLLLLVRGQWRAVAWLVGAAALTVAIGAAPFLLADPTDTVYSLLTHRGAIPLSGGSFWLLVVGTPYQWVPQRADILVILGLAALASVLVIRSRHDLELTSPDLYGLLALTALTLPLLAKNVWPYYFLDAYVFGSVWWLGQASPSTLGRRVIGAAIPLVAVAGTFLTEYEMEATDGRIRLPEGLAMGVILAVLTLGLAVLLRRRDAVSLDQL
jgi:uncharacterized membrane protein